MPWGMFSAIMRSTKKALLLRKSIRAETEPTHQQARTRKGRKIKAVPFVRIAKPAERPTQAVLNQSGERFQARRNTMVQTIQKETTQPFLAPDASRIPSGM